MPYFGGSQNDELNAGINHAQNIGHENTQSVVLDGALQATSDHWAALTPHAVLNTAMGASSQNDSSRERLQREHGGYQPGSMSNMKDQLDQGSDNS
jgi:hypothetical protein